MARISGVFAQQRWLGGLPGDSCSQPCGCALAASRVAPDLLAATVAQVTDSRVWVWNGFAAGIPCPLGPSALAQGWSRAVASDRSLLQVTQPMGSSASHSRLPEFWILASSNPAKQSQRGFFRQTLGLGVATPELPGGPPDPSQGWVWSSVLAFGCQGSLRVQILSHIHREPFPTPNTTAAPRQGCSKDSRLRPWSDQSPGQLGSDRFRRTDSSILALTFPGDSWWLC